MAKVIECSELQLKTNNCYPWHEWLDGRVWQLTRGIDFKPLIPNFRAAMYTAAKSASKRVRSTAIDENTIQIQALPK